MYNYSTEMEADVRKWFDEMDVNLEDFPNSLDFEEWLYDAMWAEDDITGNGGGWYDTEDRCEEYLGGNINLAFDACWDFDTDHETLLKHRREGTLARYLDCLIRCSLLGSVIHFFVGQDERFERFDEVWEGQL